MEGAVVGLVVYGAYLLASAVVVGRQAAHG
jgi:hypothetical protein